MSRTGRRFWRPPVLLSSRVFEYGGQDGYERELSSSPQGSDIARIPRLVTVSPVIWDVQAIKISTVRDGKRKLEPLGEIEVPADLPVWLAQSTRSATLSLPS